MKPTDRSKPHFGNLRNFVSAELFIKIVLEACMKCRCAEVENKRKAGCVEGRFTINSECINFIWPICYVNGDIR